MIEFREEDIKYIAIELPDEVKFYKYAGDFEGEEKVVLSLLKGEMPTAYDTKVAAAQAREAFKAKYPNRADFQGAWILLNK